MLQQRFLCVSAAPYLSGFSATGPSQSGIHLCQFVTDSAVFSRSFVYTRERLCYFYPLSQSAPIFKLTDCGEFNKMQRAIQITTEVNAWKLLYSTVQRLR